MKDPFLAGFGGQEEAECPVAGVHSAVNEQSLVALSILHSNQENPPSHPCLCMHATLSTPLL